jgi:hypothetical protein
VDNYGPAVGGAVLAVLVTSLAVSFGLELISRKSISAENFSDKFLHSNLIKTSSKQEI